MSALADRLGPLTRLLADLRRTELRVLLAALAVFAGVWAFLGLTGEVREGETSRFDTALLLALRRTGDLATPIGPRWFREAARDITALGGFTVLALIVVVAILILWLQGRRIQALVFGAAVITGQVAAQLVKALIGRPRPDLVPHLDLVYSSSFPSGHSAMAPIVYLTLAGIVAAGQSRRAIKVLLIGGAILLVLAVGATRVYLGVHWPTDVLAGWTMGAVTALVATLVLHLAAPHQRAGASVAPDAPDAS